MNPRSPRRLMTSAACVLALATAAGCGGKTTAKGADGGACIGVRPDDSAFSAMAGPRRSGIGVPGSTAIGTAAPAWKLKDIQPQSCGKGATYGLETSNGHVVVLALLVGW